VGTYRQVAFKLGSWIDVGWYARALGSHPPEPGPPRALPAVVDTAEFGQALLAGLAGWRAT
jgi:hypothetical protein